ncbi:hypothetical protein MNEG_0404 [Monoraphidium neglectum]|uniref:Uncharacterized protein n=1 Tax=Monoraphidium neglectum TaxID=145388 RepID=A0A0D2N5J0_9CHLO|nr:hypothetical protein MNEG_0404 [Monoraphidium neglectum]KIZ07542.1 hypothetical protein MNEG_0404 [Monoraphidium neglectum]|eukprot:XP_013906561.1 hypothetical protein MNEG_0404 [Monoraphidium neglectum]
MSTTTITAAEDAPVRSSAAIAAGEQQPWDWHWRNIKWSLVLRAQHWGVIFLIVIAAAVSGGAHYTLQHNPRIRPALAYDATISYPTVEQVAVPDSQAALWPWLAFLVSLFVTEGLLFRGRHSATTAMAAFLHFGVACFANFLIIVAVSEASVTKPWAGRLRPDFLDRCRPVDLGGSQPGGGGNFTRSVGTINLFQVWK